MTVKAKIKNDLWRINYIIPFVKKHQYDNNGKFNLAKHMLCGYCNIRPVKGKGKRSVGNDTKALLSSINITIDENSKFVYFLDTKKTIATPGNILSNFTIDYDKIIHGTWDNLADKAIGNDNYGHEARLVADGIVTLVERIKEALKLSSMPKEVKNIRIHDFGVMLSQPAEHFDEALQRILFFNQVMWQTRHRLNGLGRLDKILGDLYKDDLKEGYATSADAEELIYDFLNQLSKYSDYKSDALEGDIGQIIILGGINSDGSYFSNELTYMFLKSQARLKKTDPKTFLRVSKKMPTKLLECAVDCLLSQTGSPLFSNDDVAIPALIEFGIERNDAYEYCTSACWEPFITGKSLDQNNIGVFDCFLALETVIKTDFDSFDNLVTSYIEQNERNFKAFLQDLGELKWAKDPLVSILTDGCSQSRKDISDGGCQYKDYGITTVALSNVVDSLLEIKKLVFDKKQFSLTDLNQMRLNNFLGNDDVCSMLQRDGKHFGSNDEDAVVLTNRITQSLALIAEEYKNPYGGSVKFGLSSPGYNMLSKKTQADFSGRKRGMPYNTHISCMTASYTEVVEFASMLEYDRHRFNGNVVDFFVSPVLIEQNKDKFVLFMKASISLGFFQMQMNIMDSATLIDAKAHPEKYPGLIVRVWGFSAYFNELPESYKDLLIERALAAENVA